MVFKFSSRTRRSHSAKRRILARHRHTILGIERLETRTLLASDYQNIFFPPDVTDDGEVAPIDVLVVINQLRRRGTGPLPILGVGERPSAFVDTSGDSELTPLDVLLVINDLNRRQLPAVNAAIVPLPGLKTESSVASSGQTASVLFAMTDNNFTVNGPEALIRFIVQPSEGSSLDPGIVAIRKANGDVISPLIIRPDTPFGSASFALVSLSNGEYSIEVTGEDGTSGGFVLSAIVVGDVDGDGLVTDADRMLVGQMRVKRTFDPKADVNLDGFIDSVDYNRGRENTGDGSSLAITLPVVGISQDDTRMTLRTEILVGSGVSSLLTNDDFRNPFPKKLRVTSYQSTSEKGGVVTVNPDGSFTFDPRTSTVLDKLRKGQRAVDRFKYNTSTTDESEVSIIVDGVSTGADDSYSADEDSILVVSASNGLLTNDPGVNRVVSMSDTVSSLGSKVSVNPDGSFSYDPRTVFNLQRLAANDSLFDFFSYKSTSDGVTTEVTVSLEVAGKNDVPLANLDLIFVNQGNPVYAGNVLLNDSDIDRLPATSTVIGNGLTVTSTPLTSSLGAVVALNSDGSFSYDARLVPGVARLSRSEVLIDSMAYTAGDGTATSSGVIRVTIQGEQHEVKTINDRYSVTYPSSEFVNATLGVLANDTDADVGDVLRVVAFDAASVKGGKVTVFEDGSLLYKSGNGFYDPVAQQATIREGEVQQDTFTYTVSDGHGSQRTATVTFDVTGRKNPFDDFYVAEATTVLSVPAAGGLLINEPFERSRIKQSPAVSKFGARVITNPSEDGSFTYNASQIYLLIEPDAEGAFYDEFQYTVEDLDTLNTVVSTARIKVLTASQSGNDDPKSTPTIQAAIDANRVLKIKNLVQSAYGGEIQVQTINLSNSSVPKVRVLGLHTATIPGTPPKDIRKTVIVGDFTSADFDKIDFEGNEGKDVLYINNIEEYPLTARGLGGDDFLSGGYGTADIDGGEGNDVAIGGVKASTLRGGGGNDELVGGEEGDTLLGGAGDDTLFGNGGNDGLFGEVGDDYLRGDLGSDRYVGGTGRDRFEDDSPDSEPSLLVNANRSEGDRYSLGKSISAKSLVTGIKSERQSFADLEVEGGVLVASIADVVNNPNGSLQGTTLTINGPTQYGYTFTGQWTITTDGSGNEVFTNNGPITIQTGFGPVTSPTSIPMRIVTAADDFVGAGEISATFDLQSFIIGLITGQGQASGASFTQKLREMTGMSLNFPLGISVGFALGSEIREIAGFENVPLANPLPYFYFRFALGGNLFSLGETSISTATAPEVIIAFDPLDPMLYLKVQPVPGVKGVTSLGLAGSVHGYIPFRSDNSIPTYFTQRNMGSSNLYGHIYLEGGLDISEFVPKIPLEIAGNILLDLDANDDGTVVGGIGQLADDILLKGDTSGLSDAFGSILGDIAVGINGKLNLVAPLPGDLLSLSVPLGGGTMLAKNGVIAFSGASSQPFADVPFLKGIEVSNSKIEGFVDVKNGQFAFDYSMTAPKFWGVQLNNSSQSFHINNQGAALSGTISTPLGLTVNVNGSLSFETGEFKLNGSVDYTLDLKIFKPTVTLNVTLSNYGSLGYGLYLDASFSAGFESIAFDLKFSLAFSFAAAQNGFTIAGSGSARGDVYLPNLFYPNTRSARSYLFGVSVGFAISNSGFSIDLPSPIPDISVSF